MDAYFSGPYQVSKAIDTKENFENRITIYTFINDVFGNFPIISNLTDYEDMTPYLYNLEYYKVGWIHDKICPLIGQGYIYFGIILSPILCIISVWFSLKFSDKTKRAKNELEKYIYEYMAILLGIYMCLNMNILFQNIWIKILPLYLIYRINIKIKKE